MPTRRNFLAAAAAAALTPRLTWADAGGPGYLAAARMPGGDYRLFGLDGAARPVFSLPIPGRGHAATAHPERPEAVAFARRPGTFALVLDCTTGGVKARLESPPERHFMGHGTFSRDGGLLYTPENAYEIGEGRIGVWDASAGYARVGEFPSGGVGPHDVARLPGGDRLVVANGGIDTHPDTGREKLNIPTMRPNLTLIGLDAGILEQVELAPEMHKSSIRHLALRGDGLVAFACQWEGDLAAVPPLLGLWRPGAAPVLLLTDREDIEGYIGSVAFSGDGSRVAVTAPRASRLLVFDADTHAHVETLPIPDVGGVAPGAGTGGIVVTGGEGHCGAPGALHRMDLAWDNHLVRTGGPAPGQG